jgi:anaerobic ribonucleoside-triphosphate reductase activating protein
LITSGTPPPPQYVAEDVVHVARIIGGTTAEGPGRRTALWVQGCTLQCPGCFNPHYWSSRGGQPWSSATLAAHLIEQAVENEAEGVTLLGGEPFEQAAPLASVAQEVRSAGLTVMTFTGYLLDDLKAWSAEREDIGALLATTDLLVDGPYQASSIDRRRPWVGSANQTFHALTDRYRELVHELDAHPDRLEIRVESDGTVSVNGWADDEMLDALLHDMGRRKR